MPALAPTPAAPPPVPALPAPPPGVDEPPPQLASIAASGNANGNQRREINEDLPSRRA